MFPLVSTSSLDSIRASLSDCKDFLNLASSSSLSRSSSSSLVSERALVSACLARCSAASRSWLYRSARVCSSASCYRERKTSTCKMMSHQFLYHSLHNINNTHYKDTRHNSHIVKLLLLLLQLRDLSTLAFKGHSHVIKLQQGMLITMYHMRQ